jgi:hypothetical protein
VTFMKKAELKQHILNHIIGCNIELKNGNEWFNDTTHNQTSMETMELVLSWLGVSDIEIKEWKNSNYAKTYHR